jgi:hypothetical protein
MEGTMTVAVDFEQFNTVRQAIADLIPQRAVEQGWNVANLSVSIDERRQRWTADLIGVTGIDIETMRYTAGAEQREQYVVRLDTGYVAELQAADATGLIDQVRQIMQALGFGS